MKSDSGKDGDSQIDKLVQDVSQLKDNLRSISNSLVNITDDAIKSRYRATRDHALSWLGANRSAPHAEMDLMLPLFSNRLPIDWLLGPLDTSPASLYNPLGILDDLAGISSALGPNLFGSNTHGRTPFGHFAMNTPLPYQYKDCVDKNGLAVWESSGYWRCLFPNSQVPADLMEYKNAHLHGKIMTREDFEEAAHTGSEKLGAIDLGPKGLFFRHFEDLLAHRNRQYMQSQVQPEAIYDPKDPAKQVVGTSIESRYVSNPETHRNEMEETKTQRFSDGTSVTETIRKYKPYGSSDWVEISDMSGEGDKSSGWFWKNDK